MSWIAKLYETYEVAQRLPLSPQDRPQPEGHVSQNAHINVVIDGTGHCKRARVLEAKTQIVLQATESSAGRTSGEAPHPLQDKIQYVAADYAAFGGGKKAYFEGYRAQLKAWCQFLQERSDPALSKIDAVLTYVQAGHVVRDLVDHRIMWCDPKGLLATNLEDLPQEDRPKAALLKVLPKAEGAVEQGGALVCWTVEIPGDPQGDTWTDLDIQRAWIEYLGSLQRPIGLCFVSGRETSLTMNHPARLRHSGDKAKLISANDMTGFTFRGRFADDKKSIVRRGYQAANVGNDVTQKAHSALRWLITQRPSFRNDSQAVVAWAVNGKAIPTPMEVIAEEDLDDFSEVDVHQDIPKPRRSPLDANLGASFARELVRRMKGYRADFRGDESVVIMAVDSASPGRMGITYYREYLAHDYLDRIEGWHRAFAWPQRIVQDGAGTSRRVSWLTCAPAPWTIVDVAYGTMLKSNSKLRNATYERLLPCIVEGRNVPLDLVQVCLNRAANPIKGSKWERWDWERALGVACGLYRGWWARQEDETKRREYSVGLEIERTSRSYLYGRLLAVAESLESYALTDLEKKRPTNAERLMQRFSQCPCSTWKTIELSVQPYMQRLIRGEDRSAAFLTRRKQDLDQVMGLFQNGDFQDDSPLDGEFLLGFHCQRLEIFRKKSVNGDANNHKDDETEGDRQ